VIGSGGKSLPHTNHPQRSELADCSGNAEGLQVGRERRPDHKKVIIQTEEEVSTIKESQQMDQKTIGPFGDKAIWTAYLRRKS